MKFAIRRTSNYEDKFGPCKEAYQIDSIQEDERTVKDPAKLSGGEKEEWYEKGTNHRVSKGHIIRDFPIKLWVVDINTLEDLIKFTKKYGELILAENSWRSREFLSLEIYDDYRE